MKRHLHLLLSITIALLSGTLAAQNNVGIGTNNPNASAILDLESTNKGLLIPRVGLLSVTDVVTIPCPARSLLVYNTNTTITGGSGQWNNDNDVFVTVGNIAPTGFDVFFREVASNTQNLRIEVVLNVKNF